MDHEIPAQDYGLLPKTNPAHLDTTPNITEYDPKTEHQGMLPSIAVNER